jgi:hypothetical protein
MNGGHDGRHQANAQLSSPLPLRGGTGGFSTRFK